MRYLELKKDIVNLEKSIGKKSVPVLNNEIHKLYSELCVYRNSFILSETDPLFIKLRKIQEELYKNAYHNK